MSEEKKFNEPSEYRGHEKAKAVGEVDADSKHNEHLSLAKKYFSKRDFIKSIEEAKKAEESAGSDEVKLAKVYQLLGLAYRGLNKLHKALMYHMKELELQIKIGDKSGEAEALRNIAGVYEDKGDYDKSLMFYKEALEVVDNRSSKASILSEMGGLYNRRGSFEEAIRCYNEAVYLSERVGDYKNSGLYLINLGYAHRNMDRFEEANNLILEGLERLSVSEHAEKAFEIHKFFGHYFLSKKNFKRAMENFYTAFLIGHKNKHIETNAMLDHVFIVVELEESLKGHLIRLIGYPDYYKGRLEEIIEKRKNEMSFQNQLEYYKNSLR